MAPYDRIHSGKVIIEHCLQFLTVNIRAGKVQQMKKYDTIQEVKDLKKGETGDISLKSSKCTITYIYRILYLLYKSINIL